MNLKAVLAGALLALVPSLVLAQGLPSPNQGYFGPTSGSPAAPTFRFIAPSDIDAAFGSTRGGILERGATGWGIVAPGTSGLPWVSNGTGADPGYQALTAAGIAAATITSTQIASGTITGGNIASATVTGSNIASNTVANSNLANMAANSIKGNNTGSPAAPIDLTGSQAFSLLQYTAPGTGGTAVSQQNYNQRVLWANDYGAVCDGSTNDATAFQNLINEAQTLGVPARFIGTCKINSALSLTAAIDFGGVNLASSILKVAASTNGIGINTTSPVALHDMQLLWAASETSAAGILTTLSSSENTDSRIWNVQINGAFNGIAMTRASRYVIRDNLIFLVPSGGTGIVLNNVNNCDDGDSHVYHNWISTAGSGVNAVLYQGTGGLHFNDNKINANSGSWSGSAFQLTLPSGCNTSDLFITGNSFEGLSTGSAGIGMQRASTTGTFQSVVIANNQFAVAPLACVSVPTDATGVWLSNVTVVGNACVLANSASAVAFNFDTTNGLYIAGNTVISANAGTKLTTIGATGFSSTSCVVGPNIKASGTFAASGLGSCTSITPN